MEGLVVGALLAYGFVALILLLTGVMMYFDGRDARGQFAVVTRDDARRGARQATLALVWPLWLLVKFVIGIVNLVRYAWGRQ